MTIKNVHYRDLTATVSEVGDLIDSLASERDRLWPRDRWPAMRLDRPLEVGAVGGHGPIRYFVEEYERGRRVRFRLTRPTGLDGFHEFTIEARPSGQTRLTHSLILSPKGLARVWWLLAIRPLHNALVEDALAKAERGLGGQPKEQPWSWWVVTLRRLVGGMPRGAVAGSSAPD